MKRDLKALTTEHFDILIIGAGIHGACAAYEAARRGLKTALVDKGDYCSGNSANSLKIVHGGLRYLQNFDFRRMRDSIRERNAYLRLAPHLVKPLPCILPTFGMTTKSKHALRAALMANDVISIDRNKGIHQGDRKLPAGKILSRSRLGERLPYVDTNGFTGGALWYDAQLQDTERFVLGFIKGAEVKGASVANYLKVESLISENGTVTGAHVRDQMSADEFDINAKTVMNCAGPGTNDLVPGSQPFQPSIAINLIFDTELPGGTAAGLRHVFEHGGRKWSRIFFYTPWHGKTVVGTRHTPVEEPRQLQGITNAQIDRYISEIQETTPELPLNRETLSYWHWGVIPMEGINRKNGEVDLQRHSRVINHGDDGLAGVTTVIGVKYTTGRLVAERALRRHCAENKLKYDAGILPLEPLPGGDMDIAISAVADLRRKHGLSQEQADTLLESHGDEAARVAILLSAEPELAQPVGDSSVLKAQVVDAIRDEGALTLEDVVLRRTGLGTDGHPGEAAITAAADLCAAELGWDADEIKRQKNQLEKNYTPVA